MKLLTEELKAQLPPLYAQDGAADPLVVAKFFTPWTRWTWYVTEGSEQDGDFLFFGLVVGHERELGYFALSELEAVAGPCGLRIERDLFFQPQRLSQLRE